MPELSDVIAIKIYFELDGTSAVREIKALRKDERAELGKLAREALAKA